MPDGTKIEFDAEGKVVRTIPSNVFVAKAEGDIVRYVPGTPARVATVRRIFDLCAKGHGFQYIAQRLNAAGIPTMFGVKWNMSNIAQMLGCPRSWGALVYNKWTSGSLFGLDARGALRPNKGRGGNFKNSRSDWIIVPDVHEPLVSQEDVRRRPDRDGQAEASIRHDEEAPRAGAGEQANQGHGGPECRSRVGRARWTRSQCVCDEQAADPTFDVLEALHAVLAERKRDRDALQNKLESAAASASSSLAPQQLRDWANEQFTRLDELATKCGVDLADRRLVEAFVQHIEVDLDSNTRVISPHADLQSVLASTLVVVLDAPQTVQSCYGLKLPGLRPCGPRTASHGRWRTAERAAALNTGSRLKHRAKGHYIHI